ncbi:MAG: LysE family translocator [Paracoccaceae bacterium]
MSYGENLWLYGVMLFGIIVVPGMDMLFVLSNALVGGRRAGLLAVAGIMAGGVFHTVWGGLSVGLLLALPGGLIKVLVIVGGLYMGWIGGTLLRSSIRLGAIGGAARTGGVRTGGVAFTQGVVSCVLNPKAYLFTLATFPLFVKPIYGPVWRQALVMGAMTMLMQFWVYGSMALAADRMRQGLAGNPAVTVLIGRAAGGLFLAIAGVVLWQGIALRG